ncbi:MAG: hypothetical protein RLZZ223_293 [Candidatus Parcubacteria bacterium]|jgi:hypothetical protein
MKHKFVKQIEVPMMILSAILIGGSTYFIGSVQSNDAKKSEIQIIYPDAVAIKSSLNSNNVLETPKPQESLTEKEEQKVNAKIIASKNGKRYYYSHCGGVNRIKAENKIYFNTKEEAEAKGLTLASGCNAL